LGPGLKSLVTGLPLELRFRGERWYAWAWIGTCLRRHLRTGELAFHYCLARLERTYALVS
jgi:hypothetical protein